MEVQGMVYHGHVKNGRVELDGPSRPPEGAEVEVTLAPQAGADNDETGPTLYDRLKDFIGSVDDLPPDASVNVDHYLYGHPKP
jgi:hypothetical protein